MAATLGIRIVRPVTLRKFQQTTGTPTFASDKVRTGADDYWCGVRHAQMPISSTDQTQQPRHNGIYRLPGYHIRCDHSGAESDMPASVTVVRHSVNNSDQDFGLNSFESLDYPYPPVFLESEQNLANFNKTKASGYNVYGTEPRSCAESITSGGGLSVPFVSEVEPRVTAKEGSSVPVSTPQVPGQEGYTVGNMTRAITNKPEGLGESLTWLKRELTELRKTDQDLMRSLINIQTKIRELKTKLNPDDESIDDDDDDSERTDSSFSNSNRNGALLNGSVSRSPVKRNSVAMVIEEETELEIDNEEEDITEEIIEKVEPKRTSVNGNGISPHVNGVVKNGDYSQEQKTKMSHSRRSSSDSYKVNATHEHKPEKPSLPPPPPPPTSSPSPSLRSGNHGYVIKFDVKRDDKRDSTSSSSYASSSYTSSLEELRLQDLSRDIKTNGYHSTVMPQEEEEEVVVEQVVVEMEKEKAKDVKNDDEEEDDNGESTEAAKWMDSIWQEAMMMS